MEKLYFNDFEFFRKCFAFLRETLRLLAELLHKTNSFAQKLCAKLLVPFAKS